MTVVSQELIHQTVNTFSQPELYPKSVVVNKIKEIDSG